MPTPPRRLTLPGALALNLMNMVGAGPFITLPLVAAALGPGAWLGWLAGALLAVSDGLVWAELGAALPRAGGSYAYLREIYKPSTRAGKGARANVSAAIGRSAGTGPWAEESSSIGASAPGRPAREDGSPRAETQLAGSEQTAEAAAAEAGTAAEAGAAARAGAAAQPLDPGRFLAFLYAWQLLFTASLSIASGALGLAQYAAFLAPGLRRGIALGLSQGVIHLQGTNLLAASACLLAVSLLARGLGGIARAAGVLTVGVLLALLAIIAIGLTHLRPQLVAAQLHWPSNSSLLPALGAATLITTYDYWGYYNVCFLGEEVRDPARTIPRAVLLSIAIVAVLYLLMNFAVLGALPIPSLLTAAGSAPTLTPEPMAAVLMRTVLSPSIAPAAAAAIAALIMWTAFSSIVSLLLGYSRAPYAAAREGNFFAPFARLHPLYGYPRIALLTLGLLGTLFCFFDLRSVIAALVAVRIVLQYGLQQIGVIVLRFRRPGLPRPFRMWLYPLPPVAAFLGFGFLLLCRAGAARELLFALLLGLSGTLLYLWRNRQTTAA